MNDGTNLVLVEIFYNFAKEVQGLLAGTRVGEREMYVFRHSIHQMKGLMIAEAYDMKGVVLKLLFNEFKKFAFVFEPAIHPLIVVRLNGIGKGNRDL